jgi:hypothetical protein
VTTPLFSYFIAATWIAKATLTSGTTYNLEALAVQSDQTSGTPWRIPDRDGTLRPRRTRVRAAADYSQTGDGFWRFQWRFGYMTYGQFNYFVTTYLAGDPHSSGLVTVQTYTSLNTYEAYQCTLQGPVEGEHYKVDDDGLTEVLWRFEGGTKL